MNAIRQAAVEIKSILGLNSDPVGVCFELTKTDIPPAETLNQHRYCQAVMRARHGGHVRMDAEGIACPAAAAAFGFRDLPSKLRSGDGLRGFGIVQKEDTGKKMFEQMTRLEPGKLHSLYLFPLERAVVKPDIVVIEDEIEKLMWIVLAVLNIQGGRRIQSSTAVLQAVCVDATLIPYVLREMNMSFGCYGCRDATDIGLNETVMGFPFEMLSEVAESIRFLGEKAIPSSRAKKTLAHLSGSKPGPIGQNPHSTNLKKE